MAQQLLLEEKYERLPTDDETLKALADERRQLVLECLSESGPPVALADLTRDVAARESGDPIDEIPDERLSNVKLSLYHSHLPMLDEVGLIAFDADARTVERNESELPWL